MDVLVLTNKCNITLVDFTLSNARRLYLSTGAASGVKRLMDTRLGQFLVVNSAAELPTILCKFSNIFT